jgi:hypothetical protein
MDSTKEVIVQKIIRIAEGLLINAGFFLTGYLFCYLFSGMKQDYILPIQIDTMALPENSLADTGLLLRG